VIRRPGTGARGAACTAAALACLGCADARTSLRVVSPLDPEVLEWAEAAFEAEHPDLDILWSAATTGDARERLAGGDVDVWWGAPSWALARAASEGALRSPTPVPAWAAVLPAGMGDPEGLWLPTLADPLVLAFNPDSLSRGRAPRDWIDLLHPRWAGVIAWPDANATESGAAIVGTHVLVDGAQTGDTLAGLDWMGRVDRNVRDYLPDDRAVARRVMEGFASVAPLPLSVAERYRAAGRSLDYRIPESPTPAIVRGAAIGASTIHPDAAAMFLTWLGAPEQVRTMAERFALAPADPVRVTAPPGSALAILLAGLRYEIVPAGALAAGLEVWVDRWRTAVQGRAPRVSSRTPRAAPPAPSEVRSLSRSVAG